MGKYQCTVDLLFDRFRISCMTTDNFHFYLQTRLIQTSQTGGQWYSDTSPFSIPWTNTQKAGLVEQTFNLSSNLSVTKVVKIIATNMVTLLRCCLGPASTSRPCLVLLQRRCRRRRNVKISSTPVRLCLGGHTGQRRRLARKNRLTRLEFDGLSHAGPRRRGRRRRRTVRDVVVRRDGVRRRVPIVVGAMARLGFVRLRDDDEA
jgi:hypothetical protein